MRVTHKIALVFTSEGLVRERVNTRKGEPHGLKLTCAHILDLTSHARDQASGWKTLNELPASAFIFGGRNVQS